jgi:large subunit ribosomal protein L4
VQWKGGGVAFAPRTNFEVKVNRKERRAAFRAALSDHAQAGTIAVLGGGGFDAPSTKGASSLIGTWGQELPLVVVATPDEEALIKSFRNLDKVLVTVPGELEVSEIVWARSLLVSEAALEQVQAKAGVA